nr:DUF6252 family protein [uncultured Allomuricauda sp.]
MKKLLITLCLLAVNACSNNDDKPVNPVDSLPPITQTGEDTFACLINGKPFFSSYKRRASYTYTEDGYTFSISGSRYDDEGIKTVSLVGLDISNLIEEKNYLLESEMSGNFYGRYAIYNSGITAYSSSHDTPGVLNITKIDLDEGFVSGTFEFIANDGEGNILSFTDGRFDLEF